MAGEHISHEGVQALADWARQTAYTQQLRRDCGLMYQKNESLQRQLKKLAQALQTVIGSDLHKSTVKLVECADWIADKVSTMQALAVSKLETKYARKRAEIALAQRDFLLKQIVRSGKDGEPQNVIDQTFVEFQNQLNTDLEKELKKYENQGN